MQTSSHETSTQGPKLWTFFWLHATVALLGGFVALFITEGGILYPPFLLAVAYTVVLGSILNFLNARGLTLWIWLIGLPLGALFVAWLSPFGWMFLLCFSTSFTTIRALEWEDKRWLIPAGIYGATILYVMTFS